MCVYISTVASLVVSALVSESTVYLCQMAFAVPTSESNAFERSKNIISVVKRLFLSLAQSWNEDNIEKDKPISPFQEANSWPTVDYFPIDGY